MITTGLRYLMVPMIAGIVLLGGTAFAQSGTLSMGGGFTGGTFNDFVAGISQQLMAEFPALEVQPADSAGSLENLQRIMAGDLDMAVAFAGDAYLAYNSLGSFDDDESRSVDIRAIGFLYPAISQIVTLENSGIREFADLAGKRLAVGAPGSGTHMAIERLLRQTGMLDQVVPVYISGTDASAMLRAGRIDAYHVLLGVPNATVIDTLAFTDIHVIDTLGVALRSGFFDRYPFYVPIVIPAGTYEGVEEDVLTLKDAGLWVVSANLDDDLVYELTRSVYSPAGLEHMRNTTTVAKEMGTATALRGIVFPLHPGAARYWQEIGLEPPAPARPIVP